MSSIRPTSLLLITLLSSPGVGWAAEPVQVATSRLEKAITLPRRAPAGTDRPRLGPQRRGRDPLTGVRSPYPKDWIGLRAVSADTPILVMAGHADSQQMAGSGTPGAAVALRGARPMLRGISDELYWNVVVSQAVVELGKRRGLSIRYHRPPFRTMRNGDAPGTNWSAGRAHTQAGGYALEIHFDAYGPSGIGSGVIPAAVRPFTRIDESLAREFGAYPMRFRNVLGGPKRGISILEIGKLEGYLEASLRSPSKRTETVRRIATRVVDAIEAGLDPSPVPRSADEAALR